MPLVDTRGFKLQSDDLAADFGQGFNLGRGISQFRRESDIRDKLGQALQPPTQQQAQLGEQSAGLGPDTAIQNTREDLINQARRIDPVLAQKQLKELGLTDNLKRAEASRFASQLQNTPFEQRAARIQARAESLQAQGRDAKDTIELIDMNEEQQNQALTGVQLLDLTTRERFAIKAKNKTSKTGLASAKTEILEDGTTIQALPNQEVIVRNPSGKIVAGEERLKAISSARESKQSRLQQESDREVATKSSVESIKLKARRTSEIIKEISDRNRSAARSQGTLRKALKLATQATQGVKGSLKLQLSRLLPGIDASDEAALDGALKELALVQLQQFKGPTTDFEFGVTQDISGSLGQGKQANIARIKSLDRNQWFNRREATQFREFTKAGGDPDNFAFDFKEEIKTKRGQISLEDLQDTAVANNMTIQETLTKLNK